MRNALLVVDLQNDFVEGGALPVPGGTQIVAHVARHVRHFRSEYTFVVATRDLHEDPPDHFSDKPDYINLVREKIIQVVVDKGRHAAAVSAFEAVDARGHLLVDVLREQRIDHIDICGLITEYGIRASARTLASTNSRCGFSSTCAAPQARRLPSVHSRR